MEVFIYSISILILAAMVAFVAIKKGDVDIEFSPQKFKFAFREKLAQQRFHKKTDELDNLTKQGRTLVQPENREE